MKFACLALVAALQTAPSPPPARTDAAPVASPAEAAAPAEVEPDAEPESDRPRTRQVCRYIAVTGQRFPVRSCRTVNAAPDDR